LLTDTHCHLYFSSFENDLAEVLDRAWEYGLDRILVPGIDLETSLQAIRLCENHPKLFAAVGVHPNEAQAWNHQTLIALRNLAQHPRVVAIGEIGLDYYRDRTPQPQQRTAFREQLELAMDVNKPVIVHNRQATHDLWNMLIAWYQELIRINHPLAIKPGVLHSYEGENDIALQAINHQFMIGISGPITFHNALEHQQAVSELPLESLLLETDAPFLTPHPFRGTRNQPAYVALVAEKIAELYHLPVETVKRTTARNAERLFAWSTSV